MKTGVKCMYDRPPCTDISDRLQRSFTCQSQAHSYKVYKRQSVLKKEELTHTHIVKLCYTVTLARGHEPDIKTRTVPKMSTLTI